MSEYPKNYGTSDEGHDSQPCPCSSAEVMPVDREIPPGEVDFEQGLDQARAF